MSAWPRCPLCGLTANVHPPRAVCSGLDAEAAERPPSAISEQRHRARLAALDVAQSLIGFSVTVEEVDSVLPLAEHLEAWLMRPETP